MENYKNSKIGRETAQKYGDILEMERPQTEESLRKHPRMTLQNRAKIFSPFSPLRGYDEQLAAEKQRTERVPKRILTEEEMLILKRGRNATGNTVPKSSNPVEYRRATAVECLFGYLYLKGEKERIQELFNIIWDISIK